MSHLKISINLDPDYHEFLIAYLFDMDFDGFEQDGSLLHASIQSSSFDDSMREEIERLLSGYQNAYIISEELIEPRNWNEQWEQSIQPQAVGSFWIHPTWTTEEKPDDELIELIIDPKLAFGTGYHATTRLMLEMMENVINGGEKILDAGCGTGILSIAALKLGAGSAFGFDIDEWSKNNAEENKLLNHTDRLDVHHGTEEVIPEDEQFDLIFANINRDALLNMIPNITKHLAKEGHMLISGLLSSDEEKMRELISEVDELSILKVQQKQEWIAILLAHESSN